VVAKIKNALRIVALDAHAERRGVRLGASLTDARAAVPDLCVAEADETADLTLLEAIADWCGRYTPLVALAPPDSLFLDISGCAHLFAKNGDDGEAALLPDCLTRLMRQGFAAEGAIASTPGAAWAIAHLGASSIVPPGGEAEAVATLPVAALRIPSEEEYLLDQLGLKRIGQLFGKPRASLAARIGPKLLCRLDQMLGHLEESLSPRRPAPQLLAERRFAEPVVDQDSLLQTLASLAHALNPLLERQGLGARHLEASFFRIDGAVSRVEVRTAAPLRDPKAVALLFSERLSAIGSDWDAGFGFDMVRLAVLQAEPLVARQIDLSGDATEGAGLTALIDRLGARLGPSRVTRFTPVDTHNPERAVHSEPLGEAKAAAAWAQPGAQETPPSRPVRLFSRPERVDVIAEVPEGPPLQFRWRRVLYQVTRAEGPERIASEWWRAEEADRATRDYYRVEDQEGRRYWIFREGLYGRETASPLWYVHGLFA
jgi:protein ImuB